MNGTKYYDFYAPEYIRTELIEHKERIKSIGKLSEDKFVELFVLIMSNLKILNHSIIPKSFYLNANELCKDIDEDDTAFVAINDFVRGRLWTGDTKLTNGLIGKGYSRLTNTNELYKDFFARESK